PVSPRLLVSLSQLMLRSAYIEGQFSPLKIVLSPLPFPLSPFPLTRQLKIDRVLISRILLGIL
ncbi:MAG: hypothetical protein WA865_03825, partial [Spirulinaceae cyanobacterium]